MPDSANEHLEQLKPLLARLNPKSILDVGMGRGSYGWWLRNEFGFTGHLTGLEIWAPYVEGPDALAGGNRSHYNVIHVGDVRASLPWIDAVKPDIVFAFDVLEHMSEADAVRVLRHLQRACSKAVLVSCPRIPYPQGPHNGNPFEEHIRECWTTEEMSALGSEIVHEGGCTGLWHFPSGQLKTKVSVTMNTVRSDDSYRGRPILKSVLADLQEQTFRDFEFIVVDGLHAERHRDLIGHEYPFRILHVPPKQTPMVKDRRCAIAAYKNTAIAHARGELIIPLDDGCKLYPGFLQAIVDEWDLRGNMLSTMYTVIQDTGEPLPGIVGIDTRSHFLGPDGRCVGPVNGNFMVPPMYGFATIPLRAALELNGYDEMYDGARGMEDIDMGWRLQRAGYRIALDTKHRIELYQQGQWSTKIFGENICGKGYDDTVCHCNEQTIRIREPEIWGGHVRANSVPWGPEKWAKIAPRCYMLADSGDCNIYGKGHPCPYVGRCSDVEHPSLKLIRENPPMFDMVEERFKNGICK